jgi:fibronectin type 3 domain-containing protein
MVSGVPGGTTLSSGQSAVLTVTFKPLSTGNVTGTITVYSNAVNSPAIALSGASPGSHSVALAWGASPSQPIGYYVYRGTAIGGPYTKLNLVTATQFADLNVQAGQTYTYIVSALDSNFSESSYSNPATTTIP